MGPYLTSQPSEISSSIASKTPQRATLLPALRPLPGEVLVNRQLPELPLRPNHKDNIEDSANFDTESIQSLQDQSKDDGESAKKTSSLIQPRKPLPNGRQSRFDRTSSAVNRSPSNPNRRPKTSKRRKRYTDATLAQKPEGLPSIDDLIASRSDFLDDIGEVNRIRRRQKYQAVGRYHNRPDGYTGHTSPPAGSIGRRDKIGRLVPYLTLTTPAEEGKAGTGETVYLHDDDTQWPDVPEDDDDEGDSWRVDKRRVVTREDYERIGADLEAKRLWSADL